MFEKKNLTKNLGERKELLGPKGSVLPAPEMVPEIFKVKLSPGSQDLPGKVPACQSLKKVFCPGLNLLGS